MTTGKDRTKFLRLGGAGIEIALIIAFALACKTGDNARGRGENPDPPSPPYQEPVLKDYAGEEKKVLDGVHELNKLKQSIEMDVRSWRRARAPKSGPSFGGEADKLGDRILGKCDDLENNAKRLLPDRCG